MKPFCFGFLPKCNRVFLTGGYPVLRAMATLLGMWWAKTPRLQASRPVPTPLDSASRRAGPDARTHSINQALSLLILPPDLSICRTSPRALLCLPKFTLPPCPGTCYFSCSHDLWGTLQLRQCVQNVRASPSSALVRYLRGFLHLLSGSSLNSFTLRWVLQVWLLPLFFGSLTPSTEASFMRSGHVMLLQPFHDRGPSCSQAGLSMFYL